ncbi:hypothetical protein BJY59DRAFT_52846 [Rhodotorula toruloides]
MCGSFLLRGLVCLCQARLVDGRKTRSFGACFIPPPFPFCSHRLSSLRLTVHAHRARSAGCSCTGLFALSGRGHSSTSLREAHLAPVHPLLRLISPTSLAAVRPCAGRATPSEHILDRFDAFLSISDRPFRRAPPSHSSHQQVQSLTIAGSRGGSGPFCQVRLAGALQQLVGSCRDCKGFTAAGKTRVSLLAPNEATRRAGDPLRAHWRKHKSLSWLSLCTRAFACCAKARIPITSVHLCRRTAARECPDGQGLQGGLSDYNCGDSHHSHPLAPTQSLLFPPLVRATLEAEFRLSR